MTACSILTTDLLVIGGGINGVGIARDAAGRGLRVMLCEKDDLAQHTSSASTKLIHGGLRYLETYEFGLVRHSLREREVLLSAAPHIIWPLRFVLPHHRALRPRWLIRLGLCLYDHLGGRRMLPASCGVDLRLHPAGAALKPAFSHGFEYSDCWVQDARLVVLIARAAQERGARILTRTRCVGLNRRTDDWQVELVDQRNGASIEVYARAVVNAAGPWVEQVLKLHTRNDPAQGVRLVRGSHVVVPKLFDHPYPYIFQNADGRVLFAIPFERNFTLLGTTEVDIGKDPEQARIEQAEIDYICGAVSEYLRTAVEPEQVVWSYSGVRPLFDDAKQNTSKVTRDYKLVTDTGGPALISVFGGKITTYRILAETVMERLRSPLQIIAPAWTETSSLPGGDIANADFNGFMQCCGQRYPWLDATVLRDYARNYGTEIDRILASCTDMDSLGMHFGGGLYECELRYLIEHEWAETADDVLWRRSKKGLRLSPAEAEEVQRWIEGYRSSSLRLCARSIVDVGNGV